MIPEPDSSTGSSPLRRAVIWVSVFTSFITPFMAASVPIAMPSIARRFSLNAVTLSWVATAYLLTSAVFLLPFGRLSDLIGRKKMMTAGIILFSLASILISVSMNPTWLIASRALQGMGGSMIFSTSMALLISVISPGERGRLIGFTTASVYMGLSLGPLIGGFFTQLWGWRSIFLVPMPLSILLLFLIFRNIKGEWAEAREERFDFMGTMVYICAFISLMLGVTFLSHWFGLVLLGVGATGLTVFFVFESNTRFPVFQVRLLANNRVFAFSNLAALINYTATFAIQFLLSLYLQSIRGFSPQRTGLILLAQPLLQAFFSPLAGSVSDRWQPRLVASLGMGGCAAGLFLFSFLSERTPVALIITNLAFLGIGFAFFSSPNTSAVMGAVEKKFLGQASATLSTMRMSGQMLSMACLTLLFSLFMKRAEIGPKTVSLFMSVSRSAFLLFFSLCCLGVAASLARGKTEG